MWRKNDKILINIYGGLDMITIRQISDFKDKFEEIEELVTIKNQTVFLTKNGYGSMVVMSIEKYSKLLGEKIRK